MIQNDQTTPFLVKMTLVMSMICIALLHVLVIRHLMTMVHMVYTILTVVHAILVKKTMAEAMFVNADKQLSCN